MTFPPSTLLPLIKEIAEHLIHEKKTIALAETACGGLISSSLLSYPGASKFYRGGLTLYTLESRVAFAGWTAEDTKNYRGPTTDIVANMAKHVKASLNADYVLCESGTAGPTGGSTPNRQPGYCAFAVVSSDGTITHEITTGSSDRCANQVEFSRQAMQLLLQVFKPKTSSL